MEKKYDGYGRICKPFSEVKVFGNAKVDPNLNDAFEELRKRYEVNPHLIAAGYTQEEALVNK